MRITYFVNNRKKSLLRLMSFFLGYTKYFFLRKYYFDFSNFIKLLKYPGHLVVVECLDIGSKKIGLDYNFYKNNSIFNEIAIVNSGVENLDLNQLRVMMNTTQWKRMLFQKNTMTI